MLPTITKGGKRMSFKMVGGVVALMFIAGVAASAPQGDPGDSPRVANFKTECQRGVGTDNKDLCRCMAVRLDEHMKSDEEFALAGAVIRAIGETRVNQVKFDTDAATTQDILQRKFDQISEDYHTTVSLQRKAAILSRVTGSVRACESKLSRTKT